MPAESKKLDTKCPEPFEGKSGGWVLLQLIVIPRLREWPKVEVELTFALKITAVGEL